MFKMPNTDAVYLEIPKNASSSIHQHYGIRRADIGNQLYKHQIQEMKDENEHLRGVVVLREPLDRFKSLISHYFLNGGRAKYGKMWLQKNNLRRDNIVDTVLDNFDKLNSISEPHHWIVTGKQVI